jgi:hypothetical protein
VVAPEIESTLKVAELLELQIKLGPEILGVGKLPT